MKKDWERQEMNKKGVTIEEDMLGMQKNDATAVTTNCYNYNYKVHKFTNDNKYQKMVQNQTYLQVLYLLVIFVIAPIFFMFLWVYSVCQ